MEENDFIDHRSFAFFQSENRKLSEKEQSSVNRCLKAKGRKPTQRDIAICISESKRKMRKESKMQEAEVTGPNINNLPGNRKLIRLD